MFLGVTIQYENISNEMVTINRTFTYYGLVPMAFLTKLLSLFQVVNRPAILENVIL